MMQRMDCFLLRGCLAFNFSKNKGNYLEVLINLFIFVPLNDLRDRTIYLSEIFNAFSGC